MPAPKQPNTAAATAAVRRRGQETMAAKLREAGWAVVPPERVGELLVLDPRAVKAFGLDLDALTAAVRTVMDIDS